MTIKTFIQIVFMCIGKAFVLMYLFTLVGRLVMRITAKLDTYYTKELYRINFMWKMYSQKPTKSYRYVRLLPFVLIILYIAFILGSLYLVLWVV